MKSESHYSQLAYQDRQTIAISLEQGLSIRAIGRVLNRSAATISREFARPPFQDLLGAVDFAIAKDSPAHGEYTAEV